eukprot:jgi/Botrbrau1/41/Bobra.0022s0035.1
MMYCQAKNTSKKSTSKPPIFFALQRCKRGVLPRSITSLWLNKVPPLSSYRGSCAPKAIFRTCTSLTLRYATPHVFNDFAYGYIRHCRLTVQSFHIVLCVIRNHGTECVKSPEMLLMGNADKVQRETYDRRKREGAGLPSDVWSLGCLLFELLTGTFLFHEADWIQFFLRVTQSDQDLLPRDRLSAVSHLPAIVELLEFMLVRDPHRRPSLVEVMKRVSFLLSGGRGSIPAYKTPTISIPVKKCPEETEEVPLSLFQPREGGIMRETVAKLLVSEPSEVAPGLLIASANVLVSAPMLLKHGISDVVLVTNGATKADGRTAFWDCPAATELAVALATCAAAEVTLKVLELGPLEGAVQDKATFGCFCGLISLLSRMLTSAGHKVLVAGAPGYEGYSATVALATLVLSSRKPLHQVLVNVSHSSCALQLHHQHLKLLTSWEQSHLPGTLA